MRRKKMDGRIVVVCVVMLSLAAMPAYAAKDTLVIGITDDTASLDPAKCYETTGMGIINYLYEPLIAFEGNNFTRPVPKVAESWEISKDGRTWTFYLRTGITFASGKLVNADAVVFSLQRILKLSHPSSWILAQLGLTEDAIMKIDDTAVQLRFDQPYAPGVVLACLAFPAFSILDQQELMAHEQDGDMGNAWLEDHSASTGPYMLEQRTRTAPTEYVLVANDRYWGKKPAVSRIILKGVQNPIEQTELLEQGVLDVAWHLPFQEIESLLGNAEIQLIETVSTLIPYLGMNVEYAPLAQPAVRDAIRYALDYDNLHNFVFQGLAVPLQTFIPPMLLGHNPAQPYQRDLGKARQLLTDGGYPQGFFVELKYPGHTPFIELAMQVQSNLAEIGIQVNPIQKTMAELFAEAYSPARETQLLLWEWAFDYPDPDALAKPFAHSTSTGLEAKVQALAWWFNYVNKETSELVEQAALEPDQAKRETLYHQITEIILDDGPFAILGLRMHRYGVRTEVLPLLDLPDIVWHQFPTVK